MAAVLAVFAGAQRPMGDIETKTAPSWEAPVPLPRDTPLPDALVDRYYRASASQGLFDQIYSMQAECLAYAEQASTPTYDQCLLARQPSCHSAALCATVETEVMSMFLEHYGGSADEAMQAGAGACAREVDQGVADMGPGVRTTLSTACHARSIADAAIAARWAARQMR